MKKLLLSILFFFLAVTPAFAQSETDWVINSFTSDIAIQTDGTVAVTETLTVDFNQSEQHGIYRDIPTAYQNANGEKTYTKITNVSVMQDGTEGKYKLITNENNLRIRIGDPDQTITGKHQYKVQYRMTGVLRSFSTYDELYWNVTGNLWEAPILKATATVTVPKDKIEKASCFEGVFGSTTLCTITDQTERQATYTSTKQVTPGEGLTIATAYTKGMVPILHVEPPKRLQDDILTPPSIALFLLVLLGGIGFIMWLWTHHGRDFWFRTRQILDPTAKEEKKPLGAREAIVVEFTPPQKLRPAELGVLMDEKADTLDITATIVDLANRSFLTIKETPKKWMFGSTDYILKRTKQSDDKLLPYEKLLLKKLFATGQTVAVSSLKTTFYDDLALVKKQLYKDVMDKKLFVDHPESIRTKYLWSAIIIVVIGFALVFASFHLIMAMALTSGFAFVLVGILLLLVAQYMPRRSALGREMYIRTKGYKRFISGAEQYRQQFFEKKNMFNEVLPYAIVFGLTGKFAKAMKDMGIQTQNPTWYTGTHVFTPIVFANDVDNFSKSLSSAIASTPSSSGSSGGSSGGGFGGGGGGSW